MTVSAQTPDVGEASESLPVNYKGERLEIGFNPQFLQDGLEGVGGGRAAPEADQSAAAGSDRGGRAAATGRRAVPLPDHAGAPQRLSRQRLPCASPASTLRDFRNYERASIDLSPGLTVVQGPSAPARRICSRRSTSAASVGRAGRRTSASWCASAAAATQVELTTGNGGPRTSSRWRSSRGGRRCSSVDGARERSTCRRGRRPLVCVFMPDRLELVKGPARLRRAHLDALVAALWPAAAARPAAYATALAQRNALLCAVRAGSAARDVAASWDHELARHGDRADGRPTAAIELLASPFSARAGELGLRRRGVDRLPAALASRRRAGELEQELRERLDSDLERGFTTHGPHRDDFSLQAGGARPAPVRLAGPAAAGLLALLLAERDALERVTRRAARAAARRRPERARPRPPRAAARAARSSRARR